MMEKTESELFNTKMVDEQAMPKLGAVRAFMDANAHLWMAVALAGSDMLSLLIAIILGLQIRRISGVILDVYYYELFILLGVTQALAYFRKGLYPAVGMSYEDELREIVSSTSFTYLILIGVTFLLKTTSVYSRLFLVVLWFFSIVLIPALRYLTRRFFIWLHLWGEPVAIIGHLPSDKDFVDFLRVNLQLGLRPVVTLCDEKFSEVDPYFHPCMSIEQIKEYTQKLGIKTYLVAIHDLNSLSEMVDRYRFIIPRVIFVMDQKGSFSLNNLKVLNFLNVTGWQSKNNLLNFWAQLLKRLGDLIVSILGLILLSPFLIMIAVLIKIETPSSWIFYRQTRVGKNGKEFNILKFRSMYKNADKILSVYLAENPAMKQEWDRYQKLQFDPRLTKVGRVLRKVSLDELPQLWNVFVGDMSLVGPRPIMDDQREIYGGSLEMYTQVTPGITGLWQVSGRNQTTFARRAELDYEYIQRWSVWLDVFILIKTIKVVLLIEGAS